MHKKQVRKNAVSDQDFPGEMSPKDNSPYVFQRDKITYALKIRELPWTEKQKAIIELIMDKNTKMVFLSGPAGSSKSILATYCGLKLLDMHRMSEIIYVRSIIESAAKSLGSLPGEMESKFLPFSQILLDKMEELIKMTDITKLLEDHRVKPIPINYLRGASFNAKYIIADEFQNFQFSEATTLVSRIGQFSKFICCGDMMQSDLQHKNQSGFRPMFDIFNNAESREKGIFCIELGKEDIMRSEILKFIVQKIEDYNAIK